MIDSHIYVVTFVYPSRLGQRLNCSMTNECIVEGEEEVVKVRTFLLEQGVVEISTKKFHAPDILGTMRSLRSTFREYPVRVAETVDPDKPF
jgi:hypothetical protein